ncbi:MAG: YbaY family lipoprotein [Candidatus Promineifilaceae bacterium]
MSSNVSSNSTRGYDIFKGVVLALLVIAYLISLLGGSNAPAQGEDVALANPAAVFCGEQGFTYEIRTAEDGSQSGACIFDDGSECDAWAYYRGECLPGGAAAALRAPELLAPVPNSQLEAGEITFSGTGSPGSTVAIVSGAEQYATAPVGDDGAWSVPVMLEGEPGPIQLTLQTLDKAGQVVAESDPLAFTLVDSFLRSLELAPFLANPLSGPDASGALIVSGSAFPGADIAVVVDGEQAAETTADDAGQWSASLPAVVPGALVTARVLRPDGQSAREIEVGTVEEEPAVPLTVSAEEESPGSGLVLLSGTSRPGQTISVTANGDEVGETTAGEDGAWTLEVALEPGDYELAAAPAADEAGSVEPATVEFTVSAPAAPVVILPALALPPFNPLTGSSAWEGKSEPGARIAALIDGEEVAETEADDDGAWRLVFPVPDGSSEISFAQLDEEGDVAASGEPLGIALPGRMPAIFLPAFSLPDSGLAFAADATSAAGEAGEPGMSEAEVAELDAAELPAITLPSGPYDQPGIAAPGTTVALLIDGEQAAEATADENGDFTLSPELEPGDHTLQLVVLDDAGDTIADSEELAATVVEAEPPVIDETETAVEGETPTIAGSAEPDAALEIAVDGDVVGETTAGPDGRWSFTLPSLPAAGAAIRARLLDENGSFLVGSTPYEVPGTEGEVAAAEGQGEVVPDLSGTISGDVTYLERIALPENAVVTVQLQDISRADAAADVLGEQVINTDGAQVPIPYELSYDPEAILANGRYNLAARIEDADGNLLFINDTVTPVLTEGNPTDDVEIQTVKVDTAVSDVVLGESQVDLPEDQTTPAGAIEDAGGQFSVLLQGLQDSGLLEQLADSDNETGYTLFAPTDEAFAGLPGPVTANWDENPEQYEDLINNFVVEGSYAPDELEDGQVLPTLGNEAGIVITRSGDLLYANGVPVVDSVTAGNSTVYALSDVILPPLAAGVQPPVIDEEGVPTFVGPLLTVVGLAEPGRQILLTVDDEPFGDIATVDENNFWLVRQNVESGIRYILAYMLDEDGRLLAISQEVVLPVP